MLQAQVFLGKGDIQKAADTLERLVKAYPGVPGLGYQLALIYLQQNKLEPAGAALKQVITANPDFGEAIILLAQVNLRSGKAEAVIPAMTGLLKKHPDLIAARLLLAGGKPTNGTLRRCHQGHAGTHRQCAAGFTIVLLAWTSPERAKEERGSAQGFRESDELNPDYRSRDRSTDRPGHSKQGFRQRDTQGSTGI